MGFSVDDDAMLLWLSNRGAAALAYAKHDLLSHAAPVNRISDRKGVFSTTVPACELTSVQTGTAADTLVGAKAGDTHAPDLIGIAQHGVVYTGGVKKISEHGGASSDDRDVPIVVSGAGVPHHLTSTAKVFTTQIAATILQVLGLNPRTLQAVRAEHTQALPHA